LTALPTISVILAVYNNAKTLEHSLSSFSAQTYMRKQLIIMDGGSTDGSVNILRQRKQNIDYWESKPDRGIYHAWNKGLSHATGDWICFLGADDYFWSPTVLEEFVNSLRGDTDPRVVYGNVAVINDAGQILYRLGSPWPASAPRFRDHMSIPHPGLLHHRSLFAEHGDFDESYRIAGDYEFLLRELRNHPARYLAKPDILIGMRVGGASSQPGNSLKLLWENRRAQKAHGIPYPNIYWLTALARVYLRLLLIRLVGDRSTRVLLDAGRKMLGKPAFWTQT
jgi:glycosyltransferase involved in cell wall biosynthesis